MNGATRTFVADARVARLATANAEGQPHVVPVCFVLEGETIYIALDEKPKRVRPERLRRVRNIIANPRVQILVDHYEEDWSRLAFVQLTGRASILGPDRPEHAEAVRLLREKYPQHRAMALADRPVIVVAADKVSTWRAGPIAG